MGPNRNAVTRLMQYKSALDRLKSMGFQRVFSDNLADGVGVTASQVRRDFVSFGFSGNRRGGYNIDELTRKIHQLLGKDRDQRVVIAGMGNIGQALTNYKQFLKDGIRIVAGFDQDPRKQNALGEIPVYPIEQLPEYAREHDIRIGIISVPEQAAQKVLDLMLTSPIEGVLNFSPIRLQAHRECLVHNVDIGQEIGTVIYYVNARNRQVNHENE